MANWLFHPTTFQSLGLSSLLRPIYQLSKVYTCSGLPPPPACTFTLCTLYSFPFPLQSATVTAMLSSTIRNTLRVSTFIWSFFNFLSFFLVSEPPFAATLLHKNLFRFFRRQTGSSRSPLATSNPVVRFGDDECYLRFHLWGQLHKCANDCAVKSKQKVAAWPRTFCVVSGFFLLLFKLKQTTVHFMQELINWRLSKHNEGAGDERKSFCMHVFVPEW